MLSVLTALLAQPGPVPSGQFRTTFRAECCHQANCTIYGKSKAELQRLWGESGCCAADAQCPISGLKKQVRVLYIDYHSSPTPWHSMGYGVRHGVAYLNSLDTDVHLDLIVKSIEDNSGDFTNPETVQDWIEALSMDYDALIHPLQSKGSGSNMIAQGFNDDQKYSLREDRRRALNDRPVIHYNSDSFFTRTPYNAYGYGTYDALFGHAISVLDSKIVALLDTCDKFYEEEGRRPKLMTFGTNFPANNMVGVHLAKRLGRIDEVLEFSELTYGGGFFFGVQNGTYEHLVERLIDGSAIPSADTTDFLPYIEYEIPGSTSSGVAARDFGNVAWGREHWRRISRPGVGYAQFKPDIVVSSSITAFTDNQLMHQLVRRTGHAPKFWMSASSSGGSTGNPVTLRLKQGLEPTTQPQTDREVFNLVSGNPTSVDSRLAAFLPNDIVPWGYSPKSRSQNISWDIADISDAFQSIHLVSTSVGNVHTPHDEAAHQVLEDVLEVGRRLPFDIEFNTEVNFYGGLGALLGLEPSKFYPVTADGEIMGIDELISSDLIDWHFYLDGFLSASVVQQAALKGGTDAVLNMSGAFHTHGFFRDDITVQFDETELLKDFYETKWQQYARAASDASVTYADDLVWHAPYTGDHLSWAHYPVDVITHDDANRYTRRNQTLSHYGIVPETVAVHVAPILHPKTGRVFMTTVQSSSYILGDVRHTFLVPLHTGVHLALPDRTERVGPDAYIQRASDPPIHQLHTEQARRMPRGASWTPMIAKVAQDVGIFSYAIDDEGSMHVAYDLTMGYDLPFEYNTLACDGSTCEAEHEAMDARLTKTGDATIGGMQKVGVRVERTSGGMVLHYKWAHIDGCLSELFDDGWTPMATLYEQDADAPRKFFHDFFDDARSQFRRPRTEYDIERAVEMAKILKPSLSAWVDPASGARWYMRVHVCDGSGLCARLTRDSDGACGSHLSLAQTAAGTYAGDGATLTFSDGANYFMGATVDDGSATATLQLVTDYDVYTMHTL